MKIIKKWTKASNAYPYDCIAFNTEHKAYSYTMKVPNVRHIVFLSYFVL